jgi:hypothetical protein
VALMMHPSAVVRAAFVLMGAFHPNHSGIMFRRPDGSVALLEAGCQDVSVTLASDPARALSAYRSRDRVWISRRAVPLTADQSCRLTAAAQEQDGRRFAIARMYGQMTPFRARGPLRTAVLGGPHGADRRRYYCDELVVEMLVAAGLIDAADARPAATYSRDLFFDESYNPFLNRHFKLGPAGWCPPAQWRPQLCDACGTASVGEDGTVGPE